MFPPGDRVDERAGTVRVTGPPADNGFFPRKEWLPPAFLGILTAATLYATYQRTPVLAHDIAEVFTFVIAFGIFMLTWNARALIDNHYFILSHEEMDMMHSLVFAVPPKAPILPSYTVTGSPANPIVNLFWQDNSENEMHFTIQRATNSTFTEGLTTSTYVNINPAVPNNVTYSEGVTRDAAYWYRVFASNQVGDTQVYPAPSIGFPTLTANSDPVFVENVVVGTPPAAPAPPTGLARTFLAPTATIPGPSEPDLAR